MRCDKGHIDGLERSWLRLSLAAFLSRGLCDQEIFPLLSGFDFPGKPSRNAASAAPGLAGLGMAVFRRDLCAFYRAGFSGGAAIAANLRKLRLQLGSFRLKKFVDIGSQREQLGYGKVFDIGRWHYTLQNENDAAL
jgi:hypothetical protein